MKGMLFLSRGQLSENGKMAEASRQTGLSTRLLATALPPLRGR
jgi:hypothetical protein